MPMDYQELRARADETALSLTKSRENWTAFLTTAARLYKYPYHEQLMIYSQRPDATACAEYDVWNKRMGRYVKRGSKGIMLAGEHGRRYVFDVSDTGARERSRPFKLWEYSKEYDGVLQAMLSEKYGAEGSSFFDLLHDAVNNSALAAWSDNRRNILDSVANSFLEEYDGYNVRVKFIEAVTVSTTYSVLSRCGIDPNEYLEAEDFLPIFDFNTVDIIAELGAAVSGINQDIPRSIEVTVKNYEREKSAERTENYDRVEVHEERGLLNPEHDLSRNEADIRQVRNDEGGLSEKPQARAVEQADTPRGTDGTSERDRQDGERADRSDDAASDGSRGSERGTQSDRPDEMGGLDEQLQGAGGGNRTERADIQLSLFHTEEEQISIIDEATDEAESEMPFAFSVSETDFENLLRLGSNTSNSRKMIAAEFSKNKGLESSIEFLKDIYHGGYGIKGEIDDFSAWYSEDGIRINRGSTARYSQNSQIYPWNDVAEKIEQMLSDGTFASNVELDEAAGFERKQISEKLWYLYHDLSDEARESGYLSSLKRSKLSAFSDETADIAEKLKSDEFRVNISSELAALIEDYETDKSLIRFKYHKPKELLEKINELSLERTAYTSVFTEVPDVVSFITDDEIDECLCGGSTVEGGRGRIYEYFSENHSAKEKIDFLKDEYGTGGQSHALSHSDNSFEDHGGKGIKFTKGDCTPIEMSWNSVSKRISELVRADRYFTPEAKEEYEANIRAKQLDGLH